MERKVVSGIMLTLLLIGILTLAFNIQLVKAEPKTWYVDDDGGADFTKIQDAINTAGDGDTIFVRNGIYYEHVVVNKAVSLIGESRDNTVIDGNGTGTVVSISLANNVYVASFTIRNGGGSFGAGVTISSSSGNSIIDNLITGGGDGVRLLGSTGNVIKKNVITNVHIGISLDRSDANMVRNNNLSNNYGGIFIFTSKSNVLKGNILLNHYDYGIFIYVLSSNNLIKDNTISSSDSFGIRIATDSNGNLVVSNLISQNKWVGLHLYHSNDTSIYHNNFEDNPTQVYLTNSFNVSWDNGYPLGGNYWSDYKDVDSFSGSLQDIPGDDGIWDSPYVIDEDNTDRYPLVNPWSPPVGISDVAVVNVKPSSVEAYVGSILKINVTVKNNGDFAENRTVTVYYNFTPIETQTISIASEENITLTFSWDTTGVAPSNYTIKAVASMVLCEANITDNTLISGMIIVEMQGDITGDNKVDIQDIAQAALAFGSYPEHPRWNSQVDINQDDKIDIRDLALIAKNFGKTYP